MANLLYFSQKNFTKFCIFLLCCYYINTTHRNIYKSLKNSDFMENSSYIKDREKSVNDLERYRAIIVYLERNPERVRSNRSYLSFLRNEIFNDIGTESPNLNKSVGLYDRLGVLLEQDEDNLRGKLKSIEVSRAEEGNWLIGRVPVNKSEGNWLI